MHIMNIYVEFTVTHKKRIIRLLSLFRKGQEKINKKHFSFFRAKTYK